MTRQIRTLVVVAVAVVAASIASFGVYRAIQRIPVRQVEIATRYAVVAAKTLPMGTRLSDGDVKRVAWPARSPVAGGFADVQAVVDRGLIAPVVENEPIVESKLAPKAAGAGLPPIIPPGMRAMSVRVDEVIDVAGFVVPGTRVDVLVTLRQRDQTMSRVVVSNVQVLTAGTRYDQQNAKDSKPIRTTVITLLVTPSDGERIALAQSEGKIMLSLRNPMDVAPTVTAGVRTDALFATPEPPREQPKPKPAPRRVSAPPRPAPAVPAVYTVEAIRAAKRTEEVVR